MKLSFDKKKLVNANLTCAFPANPNAVLEYGRFISMLPKQAGGRVVNLSVPQEAPLEIPRLSVASETMEILLGLDRLAVVVKTTNQSTQLDPLQQLDSLVGVFEAFQNEHGVKFQFSGLIGNVHVEQSRTQEMSEIQAELFRVFTKTDATKRRVVNFSWQVGQLNESGTLFINVGVKTYQTRNVSVNKEMLKQGHNIINLDAFPIDEQGLEVTIDINNRPKKDRGLLRDELSVLRNAFAEELRNLDTRLFGY
jgi:hypothetical protein